MQHDGRWIQVRWWARVVAGILPTRTVDYQVTHLERQHLNIEYHNFAKHLEKSPTLTSSVNDWQTIDHVHL